jgi:hypothetical protein
MRIQNILDNAVKKKNWSQLPDGGRSSGMDLTGRYVRNILNTVCSDVSSYLEIGLYRGGTFEAALYGNSVFALGVDDWSQNWGPNSSRDEFYNRMNSVRGNNTVEIREKSCWDVMVSGPFDAYFFDGPHGYQDQYDALVKFYSAMADDFIYIVDDYDEVKSPEVVRAVKDSLVDLKVEILSEYYFPASDGFHEGVYFSALRKTKS